MLKFDRAARGGMNIDRNVNNSTMTRVQQLLVDYALQFVVN